MLGWIAALLFFCVFYYWIYSSVLGLELPKTIWLKKENAGWQARVSVVRHKLESIGQQFEGIEDRDDNVYRTIFGLDPLRERTEGSDLAGRMYERNLSLDEMLEASHHAGEFASHVPAFPPLPPYLRYRLSSSYGYRTDPVYGGARFHAGQDFASDPGTPVYCTGTGVVEKAGYSGTGYGNEVIVNHGFGYKSRYAHLKEIRTSEGAQVSRGTLIGLVGSTGKATGPHLHYEVRYRGDAINPMGFMDLNMTDDEYRQVLDNVKEE